jgi:5-methylcytosine-specific restriction protein A
VKDGSGRCALHPRPAWEKPKDETKRITGRRLQAMRKALFQREPLCEPCKLLGRVTIATIRDHLVPLAEGGADDETNEQAICEPCHEAKSLAEAVRGRWGRR